MSGCWLGGCGYSGRFSGAGGNGSAVRQAGCRGAGGSSSTRWRVGRMGMDVCLEATMSVAVNLSISDPQVLGQVYHDALELLKLGLVPSFNHEVGHLIQEANDVVIEFFGWHRVFLVLLDQAYEALQSGIGRILGIFTQCLNESPLAGQTDLMVELALFLEHLVPLAGLDPLADGDIGYSEDHRQLSGICLAVQIGFFAVVPLDAELQCVTHIQV